MGDQDTLLLRSARTSALLSSSTALDPTMEGGTDENFVVGKVALIAGSGCVKPPFVPKRWTTIAD